MAHSELPEYRKWSIAAVRLLQGVVYGDDSLVWDIVLASRSQLENHFARLGLLLVIDEPEGLAYLRQLEDDERPEGYDELPKLFRKTRLGYAATLLSVLLREELRRFEEEDVQNERCVIETTELFDQWRGLFSSQEDEVRQHRELSTSLTTLEKLGFIRKFGNEPEAWEIRRILKARLPAAELENLKTQLMDAAKQRTENETPSDTDG